MSRQTRVALLVAGLAATVFASVPRAQTPAPFNIQANYTKYESYITVRDGKRLFTSIYVPKDTSRSYPFLMTRTPYSVAPYGVDQFRTRLGPSEAFDRAGYIFVFQDVRGRYLLRRRFRRDASAHRHAEEQHRRRRKHRYLRYRRVAAEERDEPQRTRGDLGHFVSRLLHLGQYHRQPSGHPKPHHRRRR